MHIPNKEISVPTGISFNWSIFNFTIIKSSEFGQHHLHRKGSINDKQPAIIDEIFSLPHHEPLSNGIKEAHK